MIYCHPLTHEPLRQEAGALVSPNGDRFPIEAEMPVFLTEKDLAGLNGKYERLYNRIAPFYDLMERIGYRVMGRGGEARARMEYLGELEIRPGDRVLETSIGTGANLRYLPRGAEYWGIDLSRGMLRRCRRNLRRAGIGARLCLGNAEHLPYPDAAFDVVFHMGGINFFSDKAGAIREMVRVAKPGAQLLIADETVKLARTAGRVPGAGSFYRNPDELFDAPVHLLPPNMLDVKGKLIGNGNLYCLTFRKPSQGA